MPLSTGLPVAEPAATRSHSAAWCTSQGAVGRAFKLDESELLATLEPAVENCEELGLVSPTGAVQLSWSEPPAMVGVRLLDHYFGTGASDAGDLQAGYEGDRPIADDLLEDLGLGRNPDDRLRRLHQRDIDSGDVTSIVRVLLATVAHR